MKSKIYNNYVRYNFWLWSFERSKTRKMNTTQLKYALEIEKTGSMTAAAQSLYVSQPNLTKAIKMLEEEVNIQIFQRTPKGMVPTDECKSYI